ncbi:oligopeptidase A [Fistulifera solaris]|uniref:oligopeptidase A n=1 Tax=Fistulifera solaris TaxID=1519565 RepID=A0A1Z5JIM3_FISSO|nr:oligopeptidase A [Fistulifera solaris]|eukprot:GAX13786.1 oligopeptidase A [Fistulifera solaris]
MKWTVVTSLLWLSSTNAFSSLVVGASRSTPMKHFSASTASTEPTTTTTTTNPFLLQEDLPQFEQLEPEFLTPAVETLLVAMEEQFTALEERLSSDTAITYNQVLPEIERIQFPLGFVWGVAGHLNSVKNGETLRQAYEQNQPKIVQSMSRFSQSKSVYDALQSLTSTTRPQQRAIDNSLRAMQLGGVGLQGADKERFNEIQMKLAQLSTTFSNNVLDETKQYALTVEDVAKVEGVPESAKALWAGAHAAFTNTKVDPAQGPWRITLDMPSYVAVMSHMKDRVIRETIYRAYLTRASECSSDAAKNNIPIIYETLKLKAEMAKLLGFANYAELSLASKMAPSVEAVTELTDLVAERALPAAERELEEITALARAQGGEEYRVEQLEKLQPWDVTYWSERLKESKFELTEEETRPYFALPEVLDGMFALVSRIFNIEVKAANGEAQVWHPDVSFFKVYDKATNQHIASFFLDPYSRPEDKQGGAWMDVCIGKSEAVNRHVPVAYLTCNGSPPVGSQPSLMTFREVETLFHEFGHGLQHMLTTVTVGDVSGINGVEWDAVELPSQFMENWCYDRATIYGFAKHWETGEPMPEEMFQKLKQQRVYGAGMMSCRQLAFGQVDLELHSSFDAEAGEKGQGESIFDVQRRVAAKYTPYLLPLPEDRFLCSFSHIFAGGYAAGYYSYKWAEVMSADAFSAFEEVGLDNEEAVRQVGMKFRETVLSLGGGENPMEVFKQFRGREPSPDALLRHNGFA